MSQTHTLREFLDDAIKPSVQLVTVPVTLQLLAAMRDLSETELARVAIILAAENPVAFLQAVEVVTPKLPKIAVQLDLDGAGYQLTRIELDQIDAQAKMGEKIGAIKLFRHFTNAGLKHAKDAVEFLSYSNVIGGGFTSPANSYNYQYKLM